MNTFSILFIVLTLSLWQMTSNRVKAAEPANDQEQTIQEVRIGVTDRRQPYTYFSEERIYSGILINETKKLCDAEKIDCKFTANDFHQLIEDLQTFRINTFIVIDSIVLPEIDRVSLSKPLCTINSVFIQKNDQKMKKEKSNFQRSTIGVLEASLHHFYLLDEYSHLARLKSYDLLESGILDLVFGRIDSLFTDEAFYEVRIRSTSLGSNDKPDQLVPVKVDQHNLPPTAMRLVFRQNDTELLAILNKNISTPPPLCVDLVKKTEESIAAESETTEKQVLK